MDREILVSEGLLFDKWKLLKKLQKNNLHVNRIPSDDIIGMILDDKDIDINKYPNLQVISRCGIGLNNVDMNVVNKKNILVYNISDIQSQAVADYTIQLMINILKRVSPNELLKDRTIGIIGCGRIGSRVMKSFNALGARCYVHDIIYNTDLMNIIEKCDMITLHIPLYEETKYIINGYIMGCMRDNSIIINTARGELIDEELLYEELIDGNISGFASDVNNKSIFRDLNNVIITPHIATYQGNTRMEMEKQAVNNLLDGLRIRELI